MGKTNEDRVLVRKLITYRPLGRERRKLKDNIKVHFEE
jgi:hypothetical protein